MKVFSLAFGIPLSILAVCASSFLGNSAEPNNSQSTLNSKDAGQQIVDSDAKPKSASNKESWTNSQKDMTNTFDLYLEGTKANSASVLTMFDSFGHWVTEKRRKSGIDGSCSISVFANIYSIRDWQILPPR